MTIKITIDSREVKNPLAKFLITLVGVVMFFVIFVVVFFLTFPLIWFMVLSMLVLIFTLLIAMPILISTYRIILLNRKTLEHKK